MKLSGNAGLKVGLLILAMAISTLSAVPAHAEYVPQYTSQGKIVTVGVCLPKTAKSPIYLQTWFDSYDEMKTIATINFSKWVKHDDCEFWSGMPGNRGKNQVDAGPRLYRVTYKLKVPFSGEKLLSFYSPNLDLRFDGWPDGIIAKKIASPKVTVTKSPAENQPLTKATAEIVLSKTYALPAANYFVTGSGLITLQQVWGVQINGTNGPKSIYQVSKEIYVYLNRQVGGNLTENDLLISFQPGNSMYSFFSRLVNSNESFQLMKDLLVAQVRLQMLP